MSQFALVADCQFSDEPQILSFMSFAAQCGRQLATAAERARAELHNRSCPCCHRATVESIELNNGRIGRNGRMVPGTGTLVGFGCHGCGHEWPA
jgi:cytochrome c5